MFKAYGLYTQIRQNQFYSVLLLLGFVLLLQALVFAFALFGAAGSGGSLGADHGRRSANLCASLALCHGAARRCGLRSPSSFIKI